MAEYIIYSGIRASQFLSVFHNQGGPIDDKVRRKFNTYNTTTVGLHALSTVSCNKCKSSSKLNYTNQAIFFGVVRVS